MSQQPLDDRPFKFDISPDSFIGENYGALHTIVMRMVVNIMAKDQAQTVYERYVKAFKIAVTTLKNVNQIRVSGGKIELTALGERQNEIAKQKQDSPAKLALFRIDMEKIAAEKQRQAGGF